MALTLLDSYPQSNADSTDFLSGGGSGNNIADGQAFTPSSSLPLYSCKFYIFKTGSPTGTAVAKIYNITGTYGTNAVPTGAALATSNAFNVGSLSGTGQLIELLFTGVNAINLTAGSHYFISFEYSGGDVSNYVQFYLDQSSPTATGNFALRNHLGTWNGTNGIASIFYVYGGTPPINRGNFLLLF